MQKKENEHDSRSGIAPSMYSHFEIDTFAPVLYLPEYGHRRHSNILNHAVIQDASSSYKKDYLQIFQDLVAEIEGMSLEGSHGNCIDSVSCIADPQMWGYMLPEVGSSAYSPRKELEPFKLHLLGVKNLDVPPELEHVVVFHNGLRYTDSCTLMQNMDIVIPGFADEYGMYYLLLALFRHSTKLSDYDELISSSVASAVQCSVPLLVSNRTRETYGTIDDSRITITRPKAIREILAIGILRRASIVEEQVSRFHPPTATFVSLPYELELRLNAETLKTVQLDATEMVRQGWKRDRAGFAELRTILWERNTAVAWRILNDMGGEF